jgi:hypothetical protein
LARTEGGGAPETITHAPDSIIVAVILRHRNNLTPQRASPDFVR